MVAHVDAPNDVRVGRISARDRTCRAIWARRRHGCVDLPLDVMLE